MGVPKSLKGKVIPFKFNDFGELKRIKRLAKNSAAIVLEPCRESKPDIRYLKD